MLKFARRSKCSIIQHPKSFKCFQTEISIPIRGSGFHHGDSGFKKPMMIPQGRELGDPLRSLVDVLNKPRTSTPPAFAWRLFLDVINSWSTPKELITLPTHQRVLRRCLPYAFTVRENAWMKTPKWKRKSTLDALHPHSDKIQVILENVRASGLDFELGDYNFILSHYAAVGNAQGALDLIRAMQMHGMALYDVSCLRVLQALARKLRAIHTLPSEEKDEIHLLAAQACRGVMEAIKGYGFSATPAILDLVTRILGTTTSLGEYEDLLKSVYGVDLAQPDTIPASFISQFQRSVDDAQEKGAPIPSLPSISTQTLNTVIRLTGENP